MEGSLALSEKAILEMAGLEDKPQGSPDRWLEENMKKVFSDPTIIRIQTEAATVYRACKIFAYQNKLRLEPLDAVIDARWSAAGLKNIKRLAR